MARKLYGHLQLQNAQEVRWADTDSSNFVSLKSPGTVSTNVALTLPSAAPSADQVMVSDGSGNLSFTKIADANIDSAAAIALSKLASLTASRVLTSDPSGVISASVVTSTEITYLSGVTGAVQTQIDGKAGTALDNLTVASLASQSLLVGSSSSAVASLAAGTEGQVLKIVSGSVAWADDAGSASFKDTWLNADGTSLAISHSLATTDVIVQIFDIDSGETIEVDTVDRTDANTVTVTASQAPDSGGSGWRVLILAV